MEDDLQIFDTLEFETQTDILTLLENVKCQSKHPGTLKQALQTLASICSSNRNCQDYFCSVGGIQELQRLLVDGSCLLPAVPATLFCLACAIKENEACQRQMLTSEMLELIHKLLTHKTSSEHIVQTAAFLLACGVDRNSHGQILAQDSGCLEALMDILRINAHSKDVDENKWLAITKAIGVCVNNPQNVTNQQICCCMLPHLLKFLEDGKGCRVYPDVLNLISLVIANNVTNQERFFLCGGVETLSSLIQSHKQYAGQDVGLEIVTSAISGLDACIAGLEKAGKRAGELGVCSLILDLLDQHKHNEKHALSLVLTLAHILEADSETCKEVSTGPGYHTLVNFLTDCQDEESFKIAKYLLTLCKAEVDINGNEPPTGRYSEQVPSQRKLVHELDRLHHQDNRLNSAQKATSLSPIPHQLQNGLIEVPRETLQMVQNNNLASIQLQQAMAGIQKQLDSMVSPHELTGPKDLYTSHLENFANINLQTLQDLQYYSGQQFRKSAGEETPLNGDVAREDLLRSYSGRQTYMNENESSLQTPLHRLEQATSNYKDAYERYGLRQDNIDGNQNICMNRDSVSHHTPMHTYTYDNDDNELYKRQSNREAFDSGNSFAREKVSQMHNIRDFSKKSSFSRREGQNSSKTSLLGQDPRDYCSRNRQNLSHQETFDPAETDKQYDTSPSDWNNPRTSSPKMNSVYTPVSEPPTLAHEEEDRTQQSLFQGMLKLQQDFQKMLSTFMSYFPGKGRQEAREADNNVNNNPNETSPNGISSRVSSKSNLNLSNNKEIDKSFGNIEQNTQDKLFGDRDSYAANSLLDENDNPSQDKCFQTPEHISKCASDSNISQAVQKTGQIGSKSAKCTEKLCVMNTDSSDSGVKSISDPDKSATHDQTTSQIAQDKSVSTNQVISSSNTVCLDRKTLGLSTDTNKTTVQNKGSANSTMNAPHSTPISKDPVFAKPFKPVAHSTKRLCNVRKTPNAGQVLKVRRAHSISGSNRSALSVNNMCQQRLPPPSPACSELDGLIRSLAKRDRLSSDGSLESCLATVGEMEWREVTSTVKKSSLCPGCKPGGNLNSRTYNIALETNGHTCIVHRALRQKETRTIRQIISQLKAQRLLYTPKSYSVLAQFKQRKEKRDIYDFTSDTDENYVSSPVCDVSMTSIQKALQKKKKEKRRSRIPYAQEEIENLEAGVKRFGKRWQQILCTYSFHPSRTAVDLKDKYRRLTSSPKSQSSLSNGDGAGQPFSICEIRRLKRGVKTLGYNWTAILAGHRFAPGRKATELRNMWRSLNQVNQNKISSGTK